MTRGTLLKYPDFNQTFQIHTDASALQLGAVVSQKDKPTAFYSRKLTDDQHRYTLTEKELLTTIETLKEFRKMLLDKKFRICTDNKKIMCKSFNTERVLIWQFIPE